MARAYQSRPEPSGTFADLPAAPGPAAPEWACGVAEAVASVVAGAVPPSVLGEDGFYAGYRPDEVAEKVASDPGALAGTLESLAARGADGAADVLLELGALVAARRPEARGGAPAVGREDSGAGTGTAAEAVPVVRLRVPRECVYVLDGQVGGRTVARVTVPDGTRVHGMPMGGWSMTCSVGAAARRQILDRSDYVTFAIRADRPKPLRRGRERADVDPWALAGALKRQRERDGGAR